MKTTFTKMAILVTILASTFTNVEAKISDKAVDSQYLSILDFDIENEINSNMQQILSSIDADSLQRQINKQLSEHALELQTNQMVKDADKQFPAFRFKVVIAD